jgi:predicted amino acid-binding ACT domain protein
VATAGEIRELLTHTSLPADVVDQLLNDVSAVWLLGEPAEVVAADLALCHPPLGPDEVRAVARPTDVAGVDRLTVVAHDRPGLLVRLAGALTEQGISITGASASAWPALGVAIQRLSVTGASEWEGVGQRLRDILGRGQPVSPSFTPAAPVEVDTQPQGLGLVLVTVRAPDRPGLLWAVASWFQAVGADVQAYVAGAEGDTAVDSFLVRGRVDAKGLAAALGGVPAHPLDLPSAAARMATRAAVAAAGLAAGLAVRALRAGRSGKTG